MNYSNELKKFRQLNTFYQREYILKMVQRLKYSPKFYTEEELKKILNPDSPMLFLKIVNIAKGNPEFSVQEIMAILKSWRWVEIYDNYYYAHEPNTFNYIIPILKNGRLVDIDEEIVMKSKQAGMLQNYLCEKLGMSFGEKLERFKYVFSKDNHEFKY